jgi:DNA (cytosine-5)-methyltransferase 3A
MINDGAVIMSLFDGCGTGLQVCKDLGIKVAKYYAAEIHKPSMIIAKKNHPEIIHVGDVIWLDGYEFKDIDIVIGGSPCQGFSFAGKQLNFKDPRSRLFFEFVRIVKETRAPYFFLENVVMKTEYRDIISDYLKCKYIMVNSALVSAQTRKRLYWTNLPKIKLPEDKGILFQDILEDKVDEKYFMSWKAVSHIKKRMIVRKSSCAIDPDKAIPMTARQLTNWTGNFVSERLGFVNFTRNYMQYDMNRKNNKSQSMRAYYPFSKAPCLATKCYSDCKVIIEVPDGSRKGSVIINDGEGVDLTYPKSKTRRGRLMRDKCNAIISNSGQVLAYFKTGRIRKITPIEAERLQGLPDNYTEGVSDNKRYVMLGNGWQADTIALFFEKLKGIDWDKKRSKRK